MATSAYADENTGTNTEDITQSGGTGNGQDETGDGSDETGDGQGGSDVTNPPAGGDQNNTDNDDQGNSSNAETTDTTGGTDNSGTTTKPDTTNQGTANTSAASGNDQNVNEPVKEKPEKKPTQAGWLQDTDGTWYYFTSATAKPSTGWLKSGKNWYWLSPEANGAMAKNTFIEDNGKRYYVDANGIMKTGWIKVGNDWYYANKSGELFTNGWKKIGGKWYWFQGDKNGLMAANQWITDQGKRYFLTGSGAMKTGWVQNGSDWYYTNKSGAQISNGWIKSGKTWYWLQGDQEGLMAANQWITDKGKNYYLAGSGAMKTGWVQNGSDWYYTNKSGAKVMNGWVKSGSKWYWLQGDKNGLMLANEDKAISGVNYSFNADGSMKANCQIDLGEDVVGYAASSGAISRIGIKKDGELVLTNAAGQTLSGWQKMAGKWFYGEAGTGIAQKGWLKLGKTWYYFDNSAAMVTGTRNINGKVNLFSASGAWLGSSAIATKAQGYTSKTNWLILVDRAAHQVGVFKGAKGNWNLEKLMSCVTGAPGSQTITGTFSTTGHKTMSLTTDSRARWCTQIAGGYFFHTILASEGELGHSLSHGCIRLAVPNAQWIYNNIGAGTTVVIYN